jgi:hypothetical protein
MSCIDPTIGRLLPTYVSGDVTGPEMEVFDEHLAECHECAERFLALSAMEDALRRVGRRALPSQEGREAVLEFLTSKLIDAGTSLVTTASRVLRGEDLFGIRTLPLAFGGVRGPKDVARPDVSQPASTVLATPDLNITITPTPGANQLVVTLTSLRFDVQAVGLKLLAADGVNIAGTVVTSSPELLEIVFILPEGRTRLLIHAPPH